MLNALWVVLLGMATLFVVQGALFLFMILLKKLDSHKNNQEEEG